MFSMSQNALRSLGILALALGLGGYRWWKGSVDMYKVDLGQNVVWKGTHSNDALCRAHKGCRFKEDEVAVVFSNQNMIRSGLKPQSDEQLQAEKDVVVNLKSQPQVLHVGPNLLQEEEWYLDCAAKMDMARFIFVEPNPFVVAALHPKKFFKLNKSQIFQAAVCPNDGERTTFYMFDEDSFYAAYPDLPLGVRWHKNKFSAISSLKEENVLQMLTTWVRPAWKPFTAQVAKFIKPIEIVCMTPTTLLRKAGVTPEEVGLVTLDTEGFDAKLLPLFLAIPGFAPAQITFEGPVHESSKEYLDVYWKLVNELADRGYDLWQYKHDLVALKAKPGA